MSDLQQLHINDLFHTIQGEGKNGGRRALFVRLPFCNLKCSWCDTEFNTYQKFTDGEFLAVCRQEPTRFAVVTGGEPLMNKQAPRIIGLLKSLGFEVAVETNGTFPFIPGIDFVTCSPKAEAKFLIHPSLWDHVDEFKYVVDKDFDFKTLARHNSRDGKRYSLSPEFTDLQANINRIVAFTSAHPEWRISLQAHKWMGVK